MDRLGFCLFCGVLAGALAVVLPQMAAFAVIALLVTKLVWEGLKAHDQIKP
jgi:hypothetical protein